MTKPDMINHPPHYNHGKIEPIDVIEDWGLGFCEGNAVKYIARAKHKGTELEDLKKARWYIERRIQEVEKRVSDAVRKSQPGDFVKVTGGGY